MDLGPPFLTNGIPGFLIHMIDDIQQNTDEWHMLRLGSIGGTGINLVASSGKGRTDYLYKLASEIVTGQKAPSQTFQWADRGHEYEDAALNLFAYRYGVELKRVPIRRKSKHKHISPDSLVIGCNRAVEVKIRLPHVFIKNTLTGVLDAADRRQLQWYFRILGVELVYRIQYCPEMPDPLYVQEIKPDQYLGKSGKETIEWLDKKADEFIADMLAIVERFI